MRNAYIVDYELYIPNTFIDYKTLAIETGLPDWVIKDKMGIVRKPIERSLSVSDMAKLVAKKLMSKYNVKVDLVAYAGSDFKDKYVWDVAPDVINELGIEGAYGVDLSMQCVSSIVALDLLKSKLQTTGNDSHVLMVIATKQSMIVNYKDKASSFMYDFSDGAAAVLLSNVDGKYRILESSIITDGRFSNVVYQRLGERFYSVNDANQDYLLQVNRTDEFNKIFESVSFNNFINVIKSAVERSGLALRDVDYLAILHMKRSFHEKILKELGIPPDRTIYLENYGHMQAVDPFLSLWLAEQYGKIRKGSIIVLVAAGTGWTWGATVLQRIK
ncbi:3-oxoacyl-(acyl carrier protein) synthase [Vulcanisaeta moutnovskia 768-28]|uniref:3-oxoacyl-(Acyl carrier protein) synthase n=1 Tax=Vulcanisaeta moutnovskia (strain 768-28) TaxID=985053 RepID=F0QYW1_VULM7|nr:3-oxoacyl-ACP synthase [Vulcanisaeta moutnovskia]ADY00242.1 3-oxoacyl-(acyl carrier protein) synthase [Vulcanisaeta moutnovskia 768-28]